MKPAVVLVVALVWLWMAVPSGAAPVPPPNALVFKCDIRAPASQQSCDLLAQRYKLLLEHNCEMYTELITLRRSNNILLGLCAIVVLGTCAEAAIKYYTGRRGADVMSSSSEVVAQVHVRSKTAPRKAKAKAKPTPPIQPTGYACAACGADRHLKKCARCRATRYCSVECQRMHWHEHKSVCRQCHG